MQDPRTEPQGKRDAVDGLIRDIEFELAQGIVSPDDLGQAVQAVRNYQNKARAELFKASRIDGREFAARSFQINDMLITLLEETVARIQQMQMELRGMRRVSTPLLAPTARPHNGGALDRAVPKGSVADLYDRPLAEIETAMRDDELRIDLDARPIRTPLVGTLLTRLRNALHNLPLFYVRRLAGKQTAINRVYGDWVLHLYRVLCRQQNEVEALKAQLAQLGQEDSQGGGEPAVP